jgi:hypothetical protein
MPPDYSSMWAKLGRAEELLNRLNAEVDAWHATRPYRFLTEPNEDHTCYSTFVKIEPEPDVTRWSLIFSDFIHNLRCVLDHLVWAVAVHKDPTLVAADETVLSFPIWDDPPNSDARRRIKLLNGSPAKAAVEFMQPHNRPSAAYHPYHPLSILRDLDNANKHKILYLAMPGLTEVRYKVIANRAPDEGNPKYGAYMGEIKDGTEILRIRFDRPHPETKIDFDIGLTITIVHKIPNAAGINRDDYAALGDVLIAAVVDVVGAVAATVP